MSEATPPAAQQARAEQPGLIGLSPFAGTGAPVLEAVPAAWPPREGDWGLSLLVLLLAVTVIGWLLRELGR